MLEASFVDFLNIQTVKLMMESYPVKLDHANHDHIRAFRRILEWAMTQGRWNGWVSEES